MTRDAPLTIDQYSATRLTLQALSRTLRRLGSKYALAVPVVTLPDHSALHEYEDLRCDVSKSTYCHPPALPHLPPLLDGQKQRREAPSDTYLGPRRLLPL